RPAAVKLEVLELESRTLLSAYANILVNNPALDTTTRNTQSETAVAVAANGAIISVFNDSGSTVTNSSQMTGWAVSANGGTSFSDKGLLPSSPGGDVGDPVLARDAVTGT